MSNAQVVLITGASSGFGLLGAKALASRGHTVFAAMRDVAGKNERAAAELRASAGGGGAVHVLEMDVTQTSSVDAAVARALGQAGHLDAVINNAGVMNTGISEAFTPEQLTAQLDVNVTGPFRVARAVLPSMRKRGAGLIVNVSSTGGRCVVPFGAVYNSSKWALEALSEGLRYEVSSFGVEVVLLEPGAFATNLLANSPQPADTARVGEYGEVVAIQRKMNETFAQFYQAYKEATDPAHVAQAFVQLVETPAGTRPFRSTVGMDMGVGKLNEATEPFRQGGLQAFGLSHLDRIPSQRG